MKVDLRLMTAMFGASGMYGRFLWRRLVLVAGSAF
jgi:hypothetical protein